MAEPTCCYCDNSKLQALRPYGPEGKMICFCCAFATPERAAETAKRFVEAVEEVGPLVTIGTPAGPLPSGSKGIA